MDKRLVVPKHKNSLDTRLKEFALDEDLLWLIFNKCSLRDCIRMRAVCKSWLSASKRITSRNQLPWLMTLCTTQCDSESPCFFSVRDNKIYNDIIKLQGLHCMHYRCRGFFNNADARGWLMTIDNRRNVELFHLWRRIKLQLPLPHPDANTFPYIRRAAMSDDASAVAVIYNSHACYSWALAFCRIGDEAWTRIRSVGFDHDITYHKGEFFVLSRGGSIGVIRIRTTQSYVESLTRNVEVRVEGIWRPQSYLVADSASGSLLIFWRNTTLGFKVYEVAVEKTGACKRHLVEIESLGDRVVFLGQNSSLLVMASQFPGFKGNRIYYSGSSGLPPSISIFDMEDKTIQPLLPNGIQRDFLSAAWIAPPE